VRWEWVRVGRGEEVGGEEVTYPTAVARQTDRQRKRDRRTRTDRQTDRERETDTHAQTDRQAEKERQTHTHAYIPINNIYLHS